MINNISCVGKLTIPFLHLEFQCIIIKPIFIIQKCFFGKDITFVQQGHIKLIKTDIKEIYNFTKYFYFK